MIHIFAGREAGAPSQGDFIGINKIFLYTQRVLTASSQESSSNNNSLLKAEALMAEAAKDQMVGASCLAVQNGEIIFQHSAGLRDHKESAKTDERTIYDVGSLTGSLVTCNLVMQLVAEGRLKLSDRVSKYLQNFGVLGKASITVAHLLSHTAGLPHHYSFQKDLPDMSSSALVGAKTVRGSKDALYNAVNRMALKAEPGIRHQWSEIGWLVLGFLLETVTSTELDDLADKRIFKPLHLRSTSYLNQDKLSKQKLEVNKGCFASSGKCPVRNADIKAAPFDFVTWAIGGVSGHAGLFSNVVDLATLGHEILGSCRNMSDFVPADLASHFSYAENESRISFNYGWQDLASSPELSKAKFSKKAFGRASILGSALWIDPEKNLVIALTANRKNPTDTSKRFDQFRAELATAILEAAH